MGENILYSTQHFLGYGNDKRLNGVLFLPLKPLWGGIEPNNIAKNANTRF